MAINCPQYSTDRAKKDFDHNEVSEIERRMREQERLDRLAMQVPRNSEAQAHFNFTRTQAHNKWTRKISDLIALDPSMQPRMLDKLVSEFGEHARFLGLDPSFNYSVAGEVRENLLDAKRVIEGLINTAGRISVIERLQPFVDKFQQLGRSLNLPQNEVAELLDDTITIGQIPRTQDARTYYRHNVLGRSTLADTIQRRRYNQYQARMQQAGFSKQQIDELVNAAAVVGDSFDEVATLAKAVGVDVGRVDNIGYFSRQITQRLQNWLDQTKIPELLDDLELGNTTMSTMHNRSRSTNHFIPEDLVFASQILQISPDEILKLLDDPIRFRTYIHNNLSTSQLDTLVDAGVFRKLPMSSREVLEYFQRQYEFPLSMTDSFVLDPIENIKNYTQSLQRAAGNAALLRRTVEGDGFKQGWAISETIYKQNQELYQQFVPLGSQFNSWMSQARVVNMANLEAQMGLPAGYLKRMDNIRVHPIVADQFSALMEISMSPSLLSQTASHMMSFRRVFSEINKRLIRSVLSTPQFIFRTVFQNNVAFYAGGGNMAFIPQSMLDVGRLMSKGLDSFDNTTARFLLDGKRMTYREAFETFLVNRGHNVAPGAGLTRIRPQVAGQFNPSNIWEAMVGTVDGVHRAAKDLIQYTMAHGDPVNGRKISIAERFGRFTQGAGQGINRLMDESFEFFAFQSNYIDIAYKWAMFLSYANRTDGNLFNQVARFGVTHQSKIYDNTRDIFRHTDNYFVDPYKAGRTTRWVNEHIIPFATWAMANPPMQIRHMFRNPHQFINYHRMRSFLNEPITSEDEDFNQDNVFRWMIESSPLYVWRDSETGNPIVMLTDNYDPIHDNINFINGVGDTIGRAFGYHSQFSESERQDARDGAGGLINEQIQNLFGMSHVGLKILYEQITGMDSFTGRDFSQDQSEIQPTFLGVRMAPRTIQILNKVFPLQVVDQMNPFDAFGTPTRRGSDGSIVSPGTLSWLGTERTRLRSRDYDLLDQNFALRLLRVSGLNVRTVDYDRGVVNTIDDIERTYSEVSRRIDDIADTIQGSQLGRQTISEDELTRLRQDHREAISYRFQLKMDHQRVLEWAIQNNVPPRDALRELDRLEQDVRSLPYPNADFIESIVDEAIRSSNEVNSREASQ